MTYNSLEEWTADLLTAAAAIEPLGEGSTRERAAKIEYLGQALMALCVGAPHDSDGVSIDYATGVIVIKPKHVSAGQRLSEMLNAAKIPFFEEVTYEVNGGSSPIVTIKYAPRPS